MVDLYTLLPTDNYLPEKGVSTKAEFHIQNTEYGAVNFCLLNCHNLRLMKVKESQQLKFLTPYTIDVYAHKFQSTDKFILSDPV